MKIIADLGIWYKISEGYFNSIDLSKIPLHLTAWNVLELCTSPKQNRPESSDQVVNAARTIIDLKPPYIEYDPYGYIATGVCGVSNVPKIPMRILQDLGEGKLNTPDIQRLTRNRDERVWSFKNSMDEQ